MKDIKITQQMIDAFLQAVDNEAFILNEIAEKINTGEDEARAILSHLIEHDILRVKCIWVPFKK